MNHESNGRESVQSPSRPAPGVILENMLSALRAGGTVYVGSCYTRLVKFTAKTLAAWEKSGHKLFAATEKSLYMAQGKKYVCITFADIIIEHPTGLKAAH